MNQIPEKLFVELANSCVPHLRAQKEEIVEAIGDDVIAGVSMGTTAMILVDGKMAHVRIVVELDPEDEDEDEDEMDEEEEG